jgi:hypothetical protein
VLWVTVIMDKGFGFWQYVTVVLLLSTVQDLVVFSPVSTFILLKTLEFNVLVT